GTPTGRRDVIGVVDGRAVAVLPHVGGRVRRVVAVLVNDARVLRGRGVRRVVVEAPRPGVALAVGDEVFALVTVREAAAVEDAERLRHVPRHAVLHLFVERLLIQVV